jgi:hypothetical protein
MTISLTAPFWRHWITSIPRKRIDGRISGEFADPPWVGAVVYAGDQRFSLKADGKFRFDVPSGIYVLKVCCSREFDPMRREIEIKDSDVYVELHAEPLLDIRGLVIIPKGKQLHSLASVSARRIYTNAIKRAVISASETFSLRLSRGTWKVNVENLSAGLILKSMTFGGKELQDEAITISNKEDSTLLLEITLQ